MLTEDNLIKQQARYISHEIRNQLSVSDVYCEIIKKHLNKLNIEDEDILKAVNYVQKAAKLIGNSLLDLKTISDINPQIAKINALVTESIELAKVYICSKDITIDTKLAPDADVYIDDKKFLACMINILKNAVEAITAKGKIEVKTLVDNNFVKILISNNGKPISKTVQKEIFSEGFTTKKDGSGLGLYLCKKDFEAQGGSLRLTQSSKRKTEFEICIPKKLK